MLSARRPRRLCGAAAVLQELTAIVALVTVVVLVSLGNPLMLVAVVVAALLALVFGVPLVRPRRGDSGGQVAA
jgi:hypothetical protein